MTKIRTPERDENNIKRCPDCGDTMGINRNGQDICICEAKDVDNECIQSETK